MGEAPTLLPQEIFPDSLHLDLLSWFATSRADIIHSTIEPISYLPNLAGKMRLCIHMRPKMLWDGGEGEQARARYCLDFPTLGGISLLITQYK